jgi:hypothetical protein
MGTKGMVRVASVVVVVGLAGGVIAPAASALSVPPLPEQGSKDGERAWFTSDELYAGAWLDADGQTWEVNRYSITAKKGKKVVARGATVKLRAGTYKLTQTLTATPLDYSYTPTGPAQTITRTQKMKIRKYNPRCMTYTDTKALRRGWTKAQVAQRFGHRGWQENVFGAVEQRSYEWCDYDNDYYYVYFVNGRVNGWTDAGDF